MFGQALGCRVGQARQAYEVEVPLVLAETLNCCVIESGEASSAY